MSDSAYKLLICIRTSSSEKYLSKIELRWRISSLFGYFIIVCGNFHRSCNFQFSLFFFHSLSISFRLLNHSKHGKRFFSAHRKTGGFENVAGENRFIFYSFCWALNFDINCFLDVLHAIKYYDILSLFAKFTLDYFHFPLCLLEIDNKIFVKHQNCLITTQCLKNSCRKKRLFITKCHGNN